MRISTKGRYAVRIMLDLAANSCDQFVKVKDIARRQNLSEKYLEQIIAILNKAEYVVSVRGARGGYRLAKEPSFYTIGMILRVTEGSLAPVACLDGEINECERCDCCDTLPIWKQLQDAIDGVVDHITLADLLDQQKARQEG